MSSTNAFHVSLKSADRSIHTSAFTNIEIGQKSYSYKWEIGNFTRLMKWRSEDCHYSPTFSIITMDHRFDLKMVLYPNGRSEDDVGYLSIGLADQSFGLWNQEISFKIAYTVFDVDGCIAVHEKMNEDEVECGRLLEHSVLKDQRILVHDKLCILTEITIVSDDIIVGGNGTSLQDHDAAEAISRLSRDIGSMFYTERFSDCIIASGDKEFPCHKFILSARSSVFEAMFSHDTREHLQNRVDIKELDVKVVEDMIHYIYSGKVTELESKAVDLVTAAEMYDLKELKQMCATSLCNSIRNDNVLDMLVLAETFDLPEVRRMSLEFTANHKMEIVNQDWRIKLANYPAIIADMYEYAARNE